MSKSTTLTLEQFINLFNSESELWDICYLDDNNNLQFRPEITIE